jgi:tRNA modification GTPase
MPTDNDTIVAIATPPGTGGIGVVRVSGGDCERIARAMLGSLPEPRVATFAAFVDARGEHLDEGLALYFPGSASFTGESVLELHGHGGPVVMSLLVDAVLELGARRADPGEFSKRAYLNDKLDLVQAEAIADLIGSGTAQAARAALRSLNGLFSGAVLALVEQLTGLRVYVEAAFDALLSQASVGRVMRDGYQVVIVGKPNAGKSSLMNRLSGEETAIVTEIAGTTRDVLRERINIDGLAVELVDTAGLRENPDRIEEEGIRRARKAMAEADAVLWIQDATEPVPQRIEEPVPDGIPLTIVRNKIDLSGDSPGIVDGDRSVVMLSARTGDGVDALRERIRDLAGFRDLGEGAFTARRRHVEALKDAQKHFEAGRAALRDARAGELLAEELRLAQQSLGTITGEFTPDDLLDRIFSEFCIGK